MSSENQILDVLTREGVLLSVSVRYWRAAKKLQAQDLGLDPDDVTERLISLGHKKLLPRDALAPFALIESRAHALVEASTFPFLGGLGHFLPNARLEQVTTRLNLLSQEFDAALSDFIRDYAELRVDAAREWWEAARKLVRDPDRLVATIEASFPKPEAMGRYFGFQAQLYQIQVPNGIAELDLVGVGDQRAVAAARNEAAREAGARIRAGTEDFVRDCVATLRQETASLCDDMLKSFRENKAGIHQKTLNRLLGFIDEFKTLNFAGDSELEARLDGVRRQFLSTTAEAYRDDTTASARLRQGIRDLGDAARELARGDTRDIVERFGQIGRRRFSLAA